jgi:quercetin dioxygenase-like cupin family protein
MEMKKLFSNDHYKVMSVILNAGESMPLHKATSDAFLIVKDGIGKIIFSDNEVELRQGSTIMIPTDKEHQLEVTEAFNAYVIFAADGEIKFLNKAN